MRGGIITVCESSVCTMLLIIAQTLMNRNKDKSADHACDRSRDIDVGKMAFAELCY